MELSRFSLATERPLELSGMPIYFNILITLEILENFKHHHKSILSKVKIVVMLQPADSDSFKVGTDFLVVNMMQDYVSLDKIRYRLYWHEHPSNISLNPTAPRI